MQQQNTPVGHSDNDELLFSRMQYSEFGGKNLLRIKNLFIKVDFQN